jgi:hypothetical protein
VVSNAGFGSLSRVHYSAIIIFIIRPDIAGAAGYEVGHRPIGTTYAVRAALEDIVGEHYVRGVCRVVGIWFAGRAAAVHTKPSTNVVGQKEVFIDGVVYNRREVGVAGHICRTANLAVLERPGVVAAECIVPEC